MPLTSEGSDYFTTSDSNNCELTSLTVSVISGDSSELIYAPSNSMTGAFSVNILYK